MKTWNDYERKWLSSKKDENSIREILHIYIVYARGLRMDTILIWEKGDASFLVQEMRRTMDTIGNFEPYEPNEIDCRKALKAVFGEWTYQ
jgi:hypothetical protein